MPYKPSIPPAPANPVEGDIRPDGGSAIIDPYDGD